MTYWRAGHVSSDLTQQKTRWYSSLLLPSLISCNRILMIFREKSRKRVDGRKCPRRCHRVQWGRRTLNTILLYDAWGSTCSWSLNRSVIWTQVFILHKHQKPQFTQRKVAAFWETSFYFEARKKEKKVFIYQTYIFDDERWNTASLYNNRFGYISQHSDLYQF